MEFYVKKTSNCPQGFPLTTFDVLSEVWTGNKIILPFGPDGEKMLVVVGWTDLFNGWPCQVHVAKVRVPQGAEAYLVYGGNSGVRILDDDAEVEDWNAHLPPGYGQPFVWVMDLADFPDEVRAVVGRQEIKPLLTSHAPT